MRLLDLRSALLPVVCLLILSAAGCNSNLARNADPDETVADASLPEFDADSDLWERVRAGMVLDAPDNARVRQFIDWYVERPSVLARMQRNAGFHLFHIVESVEARGLPMELALLPAIESNYTPSATSHAGAAGIWQFIRTTGKKYGLEQNAWYDARRDLVASTDAALDYLAYLNDFFDGDWELALAAYNAGEGKVAKARGRNERRGKDIDYWSIDLPRETREYVPRILALASIVRDPARYGVRLAYLPNRAGLELVNTDRTVDLVTAAKKCGLDEKEFCRLNAAYLAAVTTSRDSHRLFVPADKAETLREVLAALPEIQPQTLRATTYTVRRGDTLSTIARRHGISVASLRTNNGIRGSLIRTGQKLTIAPAGPGARGRILVASANRTYRVKNGDTLWTIARKHRITVDALRQHNGLSRKSVPQPGQTLKIPELRQAAVDAPGSAA